MQKTLALFVFIVSLFIWTNQAEASSQNIELSIGWNIISTPMVLDSHVFSVAESSSNFDIFVLDPNEPSGWATMASLGQNEFFPLYGYFINNKTGTNQWLTLNFKDNLSPAEKLFQRSFSTPGWYSIGVANDQYAKNQSDDVSDTDNPSKILSLLQGKYDLLIDFNDSIFSQNRRSVSVSDPWKAVIAADVNMINDMRETKGYAIYIKETGAMYNGFQNNPPANSVVNLEDELYVVSSANDPDGTTLEVENDRKSDFHNIFNFGLNPDDSDDDIYVKSIPVHINLSRATLSEVVDDFSLTISGVTYDNYVISDNQSSSSTVVFDLGEGALIYAGEITDVSLFVRFKALDSSNEGVTIQASIKDSKSIVAETTSIISPDQIAGVATGDIHTLRTKGVDISLDSDSAVVTTGDNAGDDYATFKLVLDVTAFEQEVFISTNQTTSVQASIVDGAGNTVAGTSTVVITSSADVEGGSFKINEGETETVTVTVTFDATTAGAAARLQLTSLTFGEADGDVSQTWSALPAYDFRTDIVIIVN
jgi:hypothetical protein